MRKNFFSVGKRWSDRPAIARRVVACGQRVEESDTFFPRLAVKFRAPGANRAERVAVVDPGDEKRGGEKELELERPRAPFRRQERGVDFAQPIEVKGDVPRFVSQDAGADLVEDWITRAPRQGAVVGRPDQFGDEQHLNFEIQSERAARSAKRRWVNGA